MRLAVSNICWPSDKDEGIASRLKAAGADAIEVAPGRIFPDVAEASVDDARRVSCEWSTKGLPIISMQALLFGRPDLELFADEARQRAFTSYLDHVIGLAGALGCGPLVFGSPKNRLKGDLSFEAASERSADVFRRVGDAAGQNGCVFCLEANAHAYGCDFMTTLDEAAEVAKRTDHHAVGMVLDTGNLLMEQDRLTAIDTVPGLIRHLHFSAPGLGSVRPHYALLEEVLTKLRGLGYAGDMTIEMRPLGDVDELLDIVEDVRAILDGASGR